MLLDICLRYRLRITDISVKLPSEMEKLSQACGQNGYIRLDTGGDTMVSERRIVFVDDGLEERQF